MPTVLLVGEVSDATATTLEERGFAIDAVDFERLLAADGTATNVNDAVRDDANAVDCALVSAGADDLRVIEDLRTGNADLPILYAVPESDAADAGAALAAGADDRILLTGERDGQRIASRIAGLDVETNGAEPNGTGPAAAPDVPAHYGGTHDDRIGALLECAQEFMDADTVEAVAETAVATAERALGYDMVAVQLFEDDGETLRRVASSELATERLAELPQRRIAETVAEPTIEEGRPIEIGREELLGVGIDDVGSSLVFPLGDHGILGLGSVSDDAFGQSDWRIGELLAANARGALDRIDRVERIEAIHRSMREMLDASSPEVVAQQAVDAAKENLGFRFVACYLEDEDTGRLEPTAWTEETAAVTDENLPVPADGDGAVEAFEAGTVVFSDSDDGESTSTAASTASPFTSRLHVPIEGHGTLLVATPERIAFDESDVQLARLLATNTARTLDRVERTQELERLETVFDTVNDMVYVHDADGFILNCTPALAERFGYDKDEVIGRNVSELIDAESQAEAINKVQELLGEPAGATRTQRMQLEAADGEEVPVEMDMSLLPGEEFRGVVGSVRDISDLLAVRERLDSQQDRFEFLFENIPDPVVEGHIEDEEATVVSLNPAFEETFGYEEAEIVGETLNDVIVPDDELEQARALDRRSAAGKVNQAEVERETQYGRREFLFRGVPYTTADGSMRGFGIYTDITDQKERERHLEVLQRLLRHNVRNDVNVLLAGLDQLVDADGTVRDETMLVTLEDTARDMLSMSQKAKRISRVIEAEHEELGEVDVAAVTRSVVDQFRDMDGGATIETDLPDNCHVLGSRAIERAIEELVSNAVLHAGPSPTIEVTLVYTEAGAKLTVADDGPGIPDAERRVLEEGEITPLQHGSGLGLWLVKHATAASGGSVSFDETTEGATVTLSLRRAREEP